jgi:hypothetical protein
MTGFAMLAVSVAVQYVRVTPLSLAVGWFQVTELEDPAELEPGLAAEQPDSTSAVAARAAAAAAILYFLMSAFLLVID